MDHLRSISADRVPNVNREDMIEEENAINKLGHSTRRGSVDETSLDLAKAIAG